MPSALFPAGKNLPVLLLSGCLLLAVAGLFYQHNTIVDLRLLASGTDATRDGSSQRRAPGATALATAATSPAHPGAPSAWTKLHSDDGPTLVRNLRAAAFPPAMIRALVLASVRESFLPKYRAALPASAAEWSYWKAGSTYYDPKFYADIRTLAREEADTVKRLLGADDAPADDPFAVINARRFGPLSAEKADQLRRLNEDYADLTYEARVAMRGLKFPGDAEKLAYLESERRADLAKLLTPAEQEAYLLRSSPAADQLRYKLAAFNPTADEFRAIFAQQQAFDEKFAPSSALNTPERTLAQTQLQESLKAALGDDRYAAYQQSIAPFFQVATRITQRLQLSDQIAADVWRTQQTYVKAYTAVVENKSLTATQRYAELTQLYEPTNTKIAALLGPTATEVYRASVNGWLTPPKPPAAPKK